MHPIKAFRLSLRNDRGRAPSQQEFGVWVSVGLSTVSRWERNISQPLPIVVAKLRAMGFVPDGELTLPEGPTPPQEESNGTVDPNLDSLLED